MLQALTGGEKKVEVDAPNLKQVIDCLEELYPGLKSRLLEDGQLRSNLAVAIDGEVARVGLLEKVQAENEVHFIPAIGGGIR